MWLNEVNLVKLGEDGADHNKLRLYKTVKASFTIEPYIQLVLNRNQRAWLTRLRISTHTLRVELGRYTKPVTPLRDRTCLYCKNDENSDINPCVDDESHLLLFCNTFSTKRNCLFGKIGSIDHSFLALTAQQKLAKLLCPSDIRIAKLINKFLNITFDSRNRIDRGESMDRGHFTDCNLNISTVSENTSDAPSM